MGTEKVEYWKKRMLDRWDQFRRGYQFHFKELLEFGVHAELETKEIKKAMQQVDEALEKLRTAISEAKKFKPKQA